MGSSTQFLHNLLSFLYTTSSGLRLHCSRKSMSVWRPCSFRQKTSGKFRPECARGLSGLGDLVLPTKQRVRRRVRLGELAHLRQLAAFEDLKASDSLPGGFARCMRSLRIGNKIAVPKDGLQTASRFLKRGLLHQGVLAIAPMLSSSDYPKPILLCQSFCGFYLARF